METKVQIVSSFHRFVLVEEGKSERKEAFAAGQTVMISAEDADDWIAKGLATAVPGTSFNEIATA